MLRVLLMIANQYTRTHKASGWTRTPHRDGTSRQTITPTDASGDRIVEFLSAGSWSNNPADDYARKNEDRAVLVSGEPLPDWAVAWLDVACKKQSAKARESLRAALDDADFNESARDGW